LCTRKVQGLRQIGREIATLGGRQERGLRWELHEELKLEFAQVRLFTRFDLDVAAQP